MPTNLRVFDFVAKITSSAIGFRGLFYACKRNLGPRLLFIDLLAIKTTGSHIHNTLETFRFRSLTETTDSKINKA